MKLDSFTDLYTEELRDLHDAESQLLKALPSLAQAAALPELQQAFARQAEQTKAHLDRLEEILSRRKINAAGNPSKTMRGLLEECSDLLQEERTADPGVLDAALIAAVQKIAHFEIAGYGCARTFAEILGDKGAAHVLQQSLDDQGALNKQLNALALRSVNLEAVEATDEQIQIEEAVVSALEAVDR